MRKIDKYIGEKQLKLFNDFDKLPNNPNDVTLKYLDKYKAKVNNSKKSSKVFGSFDEAHEILYNYNSFKKFINDYKILDELIIEGLSWEVDDLRDIVEVIISKDRITVIEFLYHNIGDMEIEDLESIEDLELSNLLLEYLDVDTYSGFIEIEDFFEEIDIFMLTGIDTMRNGKYIFEDVIMNKIYNLDTFHDLMDWVWSSKKGGKPNLYRYLDLPDNIDNLDSLEKYDGVGEYWSREIDGADNYNGGGSNVPLTNGVTLIANNIKCEDIEWLATVYKSLYSLAEQEKEIELVKGSHIDIAKFELFTNHHHIQELKFSYSDYLESIGLSNTDVRRIIQNKYGYGLELKEPITVIV